MYAVIENRYVETYEVLPEILSVWPHKTSAMAEKQRLEKQYKEQQWKYRSNKEYYVRKIPESTFV